MKNRIIGEEELFAIATPAMIRAEVSSDINRMIDEKNKMSDEYTYGRMPMDEFLKNRTQYDYANLHDWLEIRGGYPAHIVIRIFEKTGHKVVGSPIHWTEAMRDYVDEHIYTVLSAMIGEVKKPRRI